MSETTNARKRLWNELNFGAIKRQAIKQDGKLFPDLDQRDTLTSQLRAIEERNQSREVQEAAARLASEAHEKELLEPGKIHVAQYRDLPIATYLDTTGVPVGEPVDPIIISFYWMSLEKEHEYAERNPRAKQDLAEKGVVLSNGLQLVPDGQPASDDTILHSQLRAVQGLMGHISSWWPITDYSEDDFKDVFESLQLRIIFRDNIPVGIAHLDLSAMEEKQSAKIVFIALDPELHGQGLGKLLLQEMVNIVEDMGAQYVTLDTVHHRDIRNGNKGPASDVYQKAGFDLLAIEFIDTTNLPPGVTVNQLNGPLGYFEQAETVETWRAKTHEAFGVDPAYAAQRMKAWRAGISPRTADLQP